MAILKKSIPRRTFLRGTGASLALPVLDAMTAAFAAQPARPIRLAFIEVPNGIMMDKWTPATEGAGFDLPPILEPLAQFRDRMLVLSGLDQNQSKALATEVGGDHPRACTAWLTGTHARMTSGADLRAGISVDQIAAREFGKHTQLASLEVGLESAEVVGACESAYGCAYYNTISWRNEKTPLPMENRPRAIFERLFGDGGNGAKARLAYRSVLDAVTDDVKRLRGRLGAADRGKIDQYLEAVRDVERRIQLVEAQGAKVDVVGADGMTALIWAAHRNDTEIADLLLRAGADVKAANDYGATALYAAAANADPEITAMLLAAGADANARLLSGETPLMEAAERGNLETVRVLLSRGANPNAREANGGQTPLMWAISERHSAVTEELVRRGADVHDRSNNGFTALMFAAQLGDADSARVLLSGGANPNDIMPKTGLTPLIIAAAMGHTKVATLLLDKGANPEAVGADGFTPLHHAARNKEAVEMVRSLLRHGAKPNVRLSQKKPTVAASGIVLQSATPLALAAETNNLDAVKVLVDSGADPSIPTEKNTTPLMLAAGAGTDVARPRSPEERAMALETVRFLVERGADVNAAGEFGWTALHAAAYQGLNDVIEFLAGHGANLDVKDRFGQTPLSISYAIITRDIGDAYYQSPRVFRRDTADLLLKLGATPLDRSGVVGVVHRPAE